MSMMNLPTELDLKNVTKLSQAITGSELNSIISSNGYSYSIGVGGVGSYVNFVLPNNEKLNIDLNSVYITGEMSFPKFNIAATGGTTVSNFLLTSENIESMIDMVQVTINGNIVEEIRNYNLIETAIYPWNISQGYTDTIQPSCFQGGSWRMRHTLLNGSDAAIPAGTADKQPNTLKFAFPIRLSGVFSGTNKLYPTYLADGNMQLRIYLKGAESVIKCLRFTTATGAIETASPTTIPNYTLSNMKLHYKAVTVSENYYSSLMSYVGSDKYTIPIDTFYSELKNVAVAANGGSWSESINCNLSNVNAVFLAFYKTSEFAQNRMGEDRPIYPNLATCRIQINGKSVPIGPAIDFTSEEGRYNLLRALNSMRSAETIGNFSMPQLMVPNIVKFDDLTFSPLGGSNYVSLGYYYNRAISASTFPKYTANNFILPNNDIERASCFLAGFDCRKSDYETDQLVGLDLSSNGQITIQATFNSPASGAADNYTCCIFVHHTKVLSIGGGSVEIMD